MTLSPAQIAAQEMLLGELGKELDEMADYYKDSPYGEPNKKRNEGGRCAVEWIQEWITDKIKENA